MRLSGPLPGGGAQGLALPLKGSWSSAGALTLWRECTTIRFDRLRYANLTLDARALRLCPPRGGAIVRTGSGGLRIAAGTPALAVSGRLGATPIRIASGPIGFALPGTLVAHALDVSLGPAATPSRFRIANLDARIGGGIAGHFAGSDVRLAAVPLDLVETEGRWRYAGGRLAIADGAFRLRDREPDARFAPLIARGATLSLADNRIVADALPWPHQQRLPVPQGHDGCHGRTQLKTPAPDKDSSAPSSGPSAHPDVLERDSQLERVAVARVAGGDEVAAPGEAEIDAVV